MGAKLTAFGSSFQAKGMQRIHAAVVGTNYERIFTALTDAFGDAGVDGASDTSETAPDPEEVEPTRKHRKIDPTSNYCFYTTCFHYLGYASI